MNEVSDELRAFLRFAHAEKVLAGYPGLAEDGAEGLAQRLAPLYGLYRDDYEAILAAYRAESERAIDALLEAGRVPARLDALPFEPGDTVALVGDSITDDCLSWAQLLRQLVARLDPQGSIRFVDAGVSGDTTAQVVARFLAVLAERPRWILTMIGTNDARRHGWEAERPMLGVAETRANLAYLRTLARGRTDARLVWLTPTPVLEVTVREEPSLRRHEVWWRNEDLAAVAAAVRDLPDTVVDLWSVFAEAMDESLFLDGLHPSAKGQALILEALLGRLAASDG